MAKDNATAGAAKPASDLGPERSADAGNAIAGEAPARTKRPPPLSMSPTSDASSLRAALAAVGARNAEPLGQQSGPERSPPRLPGSVPGRATNVELAATSRQALPIAAFPGSDAPPVQSALTPLISEAQSAPFHFDPPPPVQTHLAFPQLMPAMAPELMAPELMAPELMAPEAARAPSPPPSLRAQLRASREVDRPPAGPMLIAEPSAEVAPEPAYSPRPVAERSVFRPSGVIGGVEPAQGEALLDSQPSDGKRRAAKRRAAGPARDRIAANDDAPSIGGLIYALNQTPSRRPFRIAGILTAVWTVLGFAVALLMLVPQIGTLGWVGALLQPGMVFALAGIALPILAFWLFASLVWRAQELKLMSSAMTEVAVRLAEPDRGAEQSIATLGQAVRQQVHFMEEAVSRALGRAGELEALVHNEVSALDRAYQDNETRIRALIQELGGERDALNATSGQMHATLRSIGNEVPVLIESLSQQQLKLAHIIEGAGQNLIALEGSLLTASGQFEQTFQTATNEINLKITGAADQLGSRILTATSGIETTLSTRTDHLQTILTEYTTALNSALGGRAEQMQNVFEEYTRVIDQTLGARAEALDVTVLERTRALDAAFSNRLQLFDDTMVRSTLAIDAAVGAKAEALSIAMETHAKQLSDTLGRQATDLDETLMHGINAVRRTSESITRQSVKAIEGLSGQADMLRTVSENLLSQIHGVTNRFETQGQSIMRAANALETANYRIDSTLQSRQRELTDTLGRLTDQTGEIDQMLAGYTANVETTVGRAFERSHAQVAEIERLRLEASQASHAGDRAIEDLRGRVSTVQQEFDGAFGQMSTRFQSTTDDLRQQNERAQAELQREHDRLRAETERLPSYTRDLTDNMRKSVAEQIRALDQAAQFANRRDITPPTDGDGRLARLPGPSLTETIRAAGIVAPQPAPQQSASAPNPAPVSGPAPSAPAAPVPASPPSRWSVGDLLSRASNEATVQSIAASAAPQQAVVVQQTPPDANVSIDSMARALDPAMAQAVWQRVLAGQRGVMVRGIYAAEGRGLFDQVVQRLGSDAAFRTMVERYVQEFDQIIAASQNTDPSGRTLEQHTSGPSGRVYLFLAHALGRLG